MTLINLLNARKALPLDITDIDIQLKYKITKFIKSTNSDEEFFRTEMSNIINEFAHKDEDGKIQQGDDGNILVDTIKIEQFKAKIDALNNTEIDTKGFSLSMEDVTQLNLSVRQMLDLDEFIEE